MKKAIFWDFDGTLSYPNKSFSTALFDGFAVSAHIGYEKPRREFYEYAKTLAGLPEVCYMIGDNPVADMNGAHAAGIKTIHVHNKEQCDADYTFDNLTEIFSVIK